MAKQLSPILVLLISLTMLGSGCEQGKSTYTVQPDKAVQEQVDWQEFTSQKHKFKFRYPQDWKMVPEIDKDTLLTFSLIKEDTTQEKVENPLDNSLLTTEYQIAIRVENNPENLSARDFELQKYLPEGRADVEKTLQNFTTAGIAGVKVVGPITPPNTGQVTGIVLAPGNGKAYSFNYSAIARDSTNDKYLNEFYQILKSLKFDK